MCIIECKADIRKHQSKKFDQYADYAVDGAKLYASYISKEMDVLFIGVSGQTRQELKISHFLQLKHEQPYQILNPNQLYPFSVYLRQYNERSIELDYGNLLAYTNTLNEDMHKHSVSAHQRAILFSGILIALEDEIFRKTFKDYKNSKDLSRHLIQSIKRKLEEAELPEDRMKDIQKQFEFVLSNSVLTITDYLLRLTSNIENKIYPFIASEKYVDLISNCYTEFLKYANNDKAFGIVLTPKHIAKLFCDIAAVTTKDVVLDNCCGTGGFLVAAMAKMFEEANGDSQAIQQIKNKNLIGIENKDDIFTLAISNMIVHGDGRTNIIKGNCFEEINKVRSFRPTVGLLNPPYNDVSKIDELKFVENCLSVLEKNGKCVAIVPMRCALYQNGFGLEIKRKLLEKHTLRAVMSMPQELFYPVGVITCIMVFEAHVPHRQSNKKTWLALWKDDGHVKTKNKNRVDKNRWKDIKNEWLEAFHDLKISAGKSLTKHLDENDEWCAEAHLETDYSRISRSDFEEVVRNYAVFRLVNHHDEA